jgi:hypothetical protein
LDIGPFFADKGECILAVGNKPHSNIVATVSDGLLNEIDIGGVIFHQEYFFHCGTPFSSSILWS